MYLIPGPEERKTVASYLRVHAHLLLPLPKHLLMLLLLLHEEVLAALLRPHAACSHGEKSGFRV